MVLTCFLGSAKTQGINLFQPDFGLNRLGPGFVTPRKNVLVSTTEDVTTTTNNDIIREECVCGHAKPTRDPLLKRGRNIRATSAKFNQNKIVNGYDPKNARPWMVLLRVGKRQGQCGGSLINHQYVLTAAHCFCFDNEHDDDLCK